jgi:hypothetical protein
MSGYTKFDAERYSEELSPVTESEYDDVMQAIAEENDWQGYEAFSQELESENFIVRNGKLYHKPEPPSLGRIGGFEL